MGESASTTAESMLRDAKESARVLSVASAARRDDALKAMAEILGQNVAEIVAANGEDLARGVAEGMSEGLQDRLRLTPERISALSQAIEDIRALADPVGDVVRGMTLPNGLKVSQVRVPFGVVGAIYEARPNVTIDIAALGIKSGNVVVLRGGSQAHATNTVLVSLLREALVRSGLPADAVTSVDDFGREGAKAMMQGRGLIDVLIPRGSAALIDTVVRESTVPVIETGSGVVHIFVDSSAELTQAVDIIENAKAQRPSVCNAVETVLVHSSVAAELLPPLAERLEHAGVVIHGDERVCGIVPSAVAATKEDWSEEYLALELAIAVVDSLDEALQHIGQYSTHHTDAILTADMAHAERFLNEVDSASVIVNASTRFTDGGEFGFGAEVGISTQKLHARGPMGLPELTSTKWIVRGQGQVRA
ncbi:glutamate-5-semialdehyde dehydrogenase [Pontimonas sp.]|nr:glutamate-5-semialdehyde dehydrogenase [Pontimonas sp.]MDB4606905.1 glutamate-5-semialdehyde dehydrogenase [Pontimonas sp.]MDC0991814.1 glutamate-5-semialdehyde dehydrogenase [Pontimonas sp.]